MAEKKIVFGSLDPKYPREAVAAVILVKGGDGSDLLYALKPVFGSIDELKRALKTSDEEFKKINVKLEGIIILPIEFDRNYQLKKEYWDKPTIDISQAGRIKHFIQAIKLPQLYQILVLPEYYDRNHDRWLLAAALPFFITSDEQVIEQYMINSKDPVDRRARAAALYRIGQPQGLNWATGEIKEVKQGDFGQEEIAN